MPARSRSQSLTREEIVDASLKLIEKHGLARLTMRAVAAEVGVTPMALYYHIEDKEELFRLVVAEVSSQWLPLQLGDQGWESSLREHLISQWEVLTRYPGLGSYLIAQPSLGVTSTRLSHGIRFFEAAGFDPIQAPLAWSFAMTYLHGRLSVDARLWHLPEAPRVEGLHANDYVRFGVEAVIQGLSLMAVATAEYTAPER